MTQENNRQEEEVLFEVEPEAAGMRLDVYLAAVTDESLSRTYLQKLMEQGMVFVNGTAQGLKKQKVRPGDRILLRFPPPRPVKAQPEPIPLAVVYEDEAVIVVNKPKGMVVHPAPGNESGTLVNALLYHCRDLSSIGGVIRPGIVHRIDKNTSGLLMAAKNDKAHLSLAAQLKAHSITRVYEALVYDNLKEDRGMIDQPLGRDPENRLRMAVLAQKGKRAVTHWEVLERFGRFTRIQARLETGRTHQIRVHMAFIHHPLMGDMVYGPKKPVMGISTQMLHARTLGFIHPVTEKYMEFHAPLPEEFEKTLKALRGNQ